MILSIWVSCSYIPENIAVSVRKFQKPIAYQGDLLSVLLFRNLGGALLVLVRAHDILLQVLKFVRLCANALDLLALTLVHDLQVGHFTGKGVLNLGALRGLE